jgi:hypothetical protein
MACLSDLERAQLKQVLPYCSDFGKNCFWQVRTMAFYSQGRTNGGLPRRDFQRMGTTLFKRSPSTKRLLAIVERRFH